MTRTPRPVESFGAEVMQALIEGSKKRIVLTLPYRKAVFFRQRVNQLRVAMRDMKPPHSLYKVVSTTSLSIEWDANTETKKNVKNVRRPASMDAPVRLIISPADSEFGDALRKAGVTIKPLTEDPIVVPPPIEHTPSPKAEGDVLAEYVRDEEFK